MFSMPLYKLFKAVKFYEFLPIDDVIAFNSGIFIKLSKFWLQICIMQIDTKWPKTVNPNLLYF